MTFSPRHLTSRASVSAQIDPDDIVAIKAAGYVAIVNNRPDGEEAGQPTGDAIRAAAEDHGLAYHAIPIAGGFSHAQLDAMAAAFADAKGPVLAYCRSGTRSCNLWALATAKTGGDPDSIEVAANGAGYDLSSIKPLLERLADEG